MKHNMKHRDIGFRVLRVSVRVGEIEGYIYIHILNYKPYNLNLKPPKGLVTFRLWFSFKLRERGKGLVVYHELSRRN